MPTISQRVDNPSLIVEPLSVRPKVAWAMLNISPHHGYTLLERGDLDSYVDGNARRITTESIHRYIKNQIAKGGLVRKTRAKPFKERKRRNTSS